MKVEEANASISLRMPVPSLLNVLLNWGSWRQNQLMFSNCEVLM